MADSTIRTDAELRSHYREPSAGAIAKQIDHLDAQCRAFIAASPFVVVSTSDGGGRCDASPRGGQPGFVRVLDDHRLALPDLSGNNRLDTYANIVASPGVGMLFLLPGSDELLRVNGEGTLTTDPTVLAECSDGAMTPRVALVVRVQEAFVHCGKAIRRSGLWEPDRWLPADQRPDAVCMLRDHIGISNGAPMSVDTDTLRVALERDYTATQWQPGGE